MDDFNVRLALEYILKKKDKKYYLGIFTIKSFNTLNIKNKKKMLLNIIH